MAPVSGIDDTVGEPPGATLAAELRKPGRSIRWLAVRLAGPGASHREIETQRRYLQKVVDNPTWRPRREKAVAIATQLGIDPARLLQPRPRSSRRGVAELAARLEVLVERGEAVAERLEQLLADSEERRGAR